MPRYTVEQRLISLGRDYDVKTENGDVLFRLDGKVRFARTFVIEDREGVRLLAVREKLLCLDPTFIIKTGDEVRAVVKRTSPSDASTTKFSVEENGRTALKASGSFLRGGFKIVRDGAFAGSVDRDQSTLVRERFHVSAADSEDPALILAIAMSIVETYPHRGEDRAERGAPPPCREAKTPPRGKASRSRGQRHAC